jgi:hypothetical protein
MLKVRADEQSEEIIKLGGKRKQTFNSDYIKA